MKYSKTITLDPHLASLLRMTLCVISNQYTIAGYRNGKLVAPATFEGACSKDLCLGRIDQILLKNLLPKQIIIMDNASIHKSKELRELIEKKGHFLLFLSPLQSRL